MKLENGAHLLGVLAGGVEEETGADGLADAVKVGACRHQVQLVAVHDLQQLLPYILFHTMQVTLSTPPELLDDCNKRKKKIKLRSRICHSENTLFALLCSR